MNLKQGIKAY